MTTTLMAALATAALGCGSKSATPDAAMLDLAPTADLQEAGSVHSSCPTTGVHGPDLVRVSWSGIAFCIDSTEVTNAHYQEFLTAAAAAPPTPVPRCGWNTSLQPASTGGAGCAAFDPVGHASNPVTCVDWCDADAYCRWAGKYLCRAGSFDGEDAGPVKNPSAPGGSQWLIACTNDGMSTYPYAGAAVPGRCVDKKFATTTTGVQAVKAATMCEGGTAGIFDMAGNASEWMDDCTESKTSADGQDDACDAYGGAQSSETVDTSCAAASSASDTAAHFKRSQYAADNGFRCCANANFF